MSGRWLVASTVGIHLCWASGALAAEWVAAPAVGVFAEYDENPNLVNTNADSNTALIVAPRARAARYTERTKFDAGAELSFARNNSDAIDDESSQRVAFRISHRPIPLNEFLLEGNLLRDTLRRDVTGGGDVIDEELPDLDSGLVIRDVDRRNLRLTPAWRRQMSQRVSGRIEYDVVDVTYSETLGTDLVEYTQHRVSTGLGYALTPQTSVGGSVGVSAYRPQNNEDAESLTISGGVTHTVTERTEINASVGRRDTRYQSGAREIDSSGIVVDAALRMRTETGQVRATLQHSALPSGLGRLLEATRVNLEWSEGLTERVGAFGRVSSYRTTEIDKRLPDTATRYTSFEAGVSWAVLRQLSLDAMYRWRQQEEGATSADSNAIFAGINYGSVENEKFSGSLRY